MLEEVEEVEAEHRLKQGQPSLRLSQELEPAEEASTLRRLLASSETRTLDWDAKDL